jgi:hypothetical protein
MAVSQDTSSEERREIGMSLMVIGFILWFFDLLILFFMPAGVRLGYSRPFEILMAAMFVGGVIFVLVGRYLRKQ